MDSSGNVWPEARMEDGTVGFVYALRKQILSFEETQFHPLFYSTEC